MRSANQKPKHYASHHLGISRVLQEWLTTKRYMAINGKPLKEYLKTVSSTAWVILKTLLLFTAYVIFGCLYLVGALLYVILYTIYHSPSSLVSQPSEASILFH